MLHLIISTFNYFAQRQCRAVIANSSPRMPETESLSACL